MSNHDMPGNDYVAVAKFRIEGVHDWQSDEGLTNATAIATALDAQNQATLAVAYEQRTANLQAERSWATGEGDTDRIQELNAQITERLGGAK